MIETFHGLMGTDVCVLVIRHGLCSTKSGSESPDKISATLPVLFTTKNFRFKRSVVSRFVIISSEVMVR